MAAAGKGVGVGKCINTFCVVLCRGWLGSRYNGGGDVS